MHTMQPSAVLWAKLYCVASAAVALYCGAIVARRLGLPRFATPKAALLMEGLGFSLSSSSISVYNDIDKTFLVSSGQLGAAGIYSAAYRVIDVVSAPIYSIYAAATPRIFREGAAGAAAANRLPRRLLPMLAAYGVFSALALYLAAPLLPLLFGPSFARSIEALRWLCLLPLLRSLHYSWGTAITGSSSQWYRTATQLLAALLNVGLDFVFIPRASRLGSWRGAAVASLLTDGTLVLVSWAVFRFLRQREKHHPFEVQAV